MARPIWSGSLSFGLVSVGVRLFTAVEDHHPHFHQFERGTGDRIRYRRVNENTGREVDYDDIVRGARVGRDEYVMLEADELESVAPGRSRLLEISDFVPADEIDPVHYDRTYFLAPGADAAEQPYALLREAMERSGRVGIATFVLRSREYLAAIRADGPVLSLSTLHFADEVRDPADTVGDRLPSRRGIDKRQLDVAAQLIDSMTVDWKPERYHDTYRQRVDELIEAKRSGGTVTEQNEPPADTTVVDLMDALRASVGNRTSGSGAANRHATGARSATKDSAKRGSAGKRSTTDLSTTRRPGQRRSAGRKPAKAGRDPAAGASKSELMARARDLEVPGRSKMSRDELARAVDRSSRRKAS